MRQIRRRHSVGRPRHFVALFAALLASVCVTDAAQAQNQDGGRYYRTTWNFRDIDLQTFTRRLTWIGIELPFEISGVATTRINVGVPLGNLRDAKAYRLTGSFDSDRLVVDGVELRAFSADINYNQGVLRLEELRFRPPKADDSETDGLFVGEAAVSLVPLGNLTLTANLTNASVPWLADFFAEEVEIGSGRLSGNVQASAPADRLNDPLAWSMEGDARLDDFSAYSVALESATTEFRLAEGAFDVTSLRTSPGGGRMHASGRLAVSSPYRFEFRVNWQQVAANLLVNLEETPAASLRGQSEGSVDFNGELEPFRMLSQGTIGVDGLRWERFALETVSIDLNIDTQRGQEISLRAPIGAGALAGKIVRRPDSDDVVASLEFESIPMDRLVEGVQAGTLEGSAELSAPQDSLGDVGAWVGRLDSAVKELKSAGVNIQSAEVAARLQDGTLRFEDMTVRLADEAIVKFSGQVGVDEPHNFEANGTLEPVGLTVLRELAPDAAWPEALAGRLEWRGELRGQMQPLDVEGLSLATLRDARIGGLRIPDARFELRPAGEVLEIVTLSAAIAEGRLTGSGRIPLTAAHPARFELAFDDVSLASLEIPDVRGVLKGEARVEAPGAGLDDPARWAGRFNVSLSDGELGPLRVPNMSIAGQAADGVVRTTEFSIDLPDAAKADLTAQVSLAAPYAFSSDIVLTDADVAALGPLAAEAELDDLSGQVSTEIKVRGSLAPFQLDVEGQGSAKDPGVGRFTIPEIEFDFQLADEVLRFRRIAAKAWEGVVEGTVVIPLTPNGRIELNADARSLRPPEDLLDSATVNGSARLEIPSDALADASRWEGVFEIVATDGAALGRKFDRTAFSGTLDDGLAKLRVSGAPAFGDAEFQTRFVLEERSLLLRELQGRLFDGSFQGQGEFAWDAQPIGAVDIEWEGVDVGRLVAQTQVQGRSTGAFRLTYGTDDDAMAPSLRMSGTLAAPRVTTRNAVLATLAQAEFDFADGLLRYESTANVLGGRLSWAGEWNAENPEKAIPGSFRLENVSIARLAEMAGAARGPTGAVDLRMDYAHGADGELRAADGQVAVRNFAHSGVVLTPELAGSLVYRDGIMHVRDLTGTFSNGRLRASAQVRAAAIDRSVFQVSLAGADSAGLLQFSPELADYVSGRTDLQLRGGIGRRLRADGVAVVSRGHVVRIPAANFRMPVTIAYDFLRGTGEIKVSGASGQIAQGRATINLTLTFQPNLNLSTDVRLVNLEVRQVLQPFADSSRLGSGRVDGTVSLAGKNVSSVNDLTGRVDLTLREAQSTAFPILRELQPFLTPAAGATTFQRGELEGRLARGVFRIPKMTLEGRTVQVFASGDVTTAGRLDLEVTASTGRVRTPPSLAESAIMALPAIGAPPVALLMRANEFLSDRVIHLAVTGTVQRPVIRPRPLPTLGAEAVRFFLRNTGAPLP